LADAGRPSRPKGKTYCYLGVKVWTVMERRRGSSAIGGGRTGGDLDNVGTHSEQSMLGQGSGISSNPNLSEIRPTSE